MFGITPETCRAFTLAEVLIMAAMNVETICLTSRGRMRSNTVLAQSSAKHCTCEG